MSTAIRDALARVATDLGAEGAEFVLERPRDPDHGDLATNLALVLARPLRRNPRHIQSLYYLGASYLQIGNASLGKAYLRRYDHLARQEEHAAALRMAPRPLRVAGTAVPKLIPSSASR